MHSTYNNVLLLEKYPNFFFWESLVDFNEARLHEATLNLHMHAWIFFLTVNSISWWQAAFEWSSQCSRIFIVRKITDSGSCPRDYGVHEVGVTVCGVQHVLGVQVRPGTRHFPFNENPTRALNTTSLKCCLPSADAIDRREKITRAYKGLRSPHTTALHWNPPGFCKKIRWILF